MNSIQWTVFETGKTCIDKEGQDVETEEKMFLQTGHNDFELKRWFEEFEDLKEEFKINKKRKSSLQPDELSLKTQLTLFLEPGAKHWSPDHLDFRAL